METDREGIAPEPRRPAPDYPEALPAEPERPGAEKGAQTNRPVKNRAQTYAGIGGLVGAALAASMAFQMFDFSVTAQMQQGIGYVVGGLIVGAFVGYVVGKSMKG